LVVRKEEAMSKGVEVSKSYWSSLVELSFVQEHEMAAIIDQDQGHDHQQEEDIAIAITHTEMSVETMLAGLTVGSVQHLPTADMLINMLQEVDSHPKTMDPIPTWKRS
jgi:hypothetical protein